MRFVALDTTAEARHGGAAVCVVGDEPRDDSDDVYAVAVCGASSV